MPDLVRRVVQLVVACCVLGVGVALLLDAQLGSDGYSTLVNGLTIATGLSFGLVNLVVGVSFVLMAWLRRRPPGIGTITQVVLVGLVVDLLLRVLPSPEGMVVRGVELLVAFVVLCVGVAGYLATDLGAGPAEAAALAWDPPLPFRWSYTGVQVLGALIGWLGGADVGVATLLVVLLIGPFVDRMLPFFARTAGVAPDAVVDDHARDQLGT